MDIEKEREVFEAWAKNKGKYVKRSTNGDAYISMTLNAEWEAWQAAKAQAIPEGFVLVPVDPTGAMVKAGSWNDYAHSLPDNHVVEIYKLMIEAQEQANESE